MGMLSKAIIAVNMALIIMQSLTGAGMLKVLAGLAVAAGAIYAMNKLMESPPTSIGGSEALASGGIVTRPTRALIGESGPEAVIPLSQMGNMGGGLTVNVGSFMGDEISLREFTRRIKRIYDEESRRSSFKPTETSYYSAGGHL
jgi:hypothetical protein